MLIHLLLMVTAGTIADSLPTVHAVRTTTAPRIDGVIDPVWHEGDSAKHFIQQQPKNGEPASDSTTVYVLFDNANLYVCYKCYARPDQLVLQVTQRDNPGGDYIGLTLDTYDDRQTCYYFSVNAKGVEYDARVTQNGDDWDDSWDGVWYSAARVTSFGYCVEMKIPFKAVRYGTGLAEWGINFDRYAARLNEQSFWSPQEQSGWRVSRAGKLAGIEPRSEGANLEVYPVGLIRYEQRPSGDSGPDTKQLSPDAGLDLAWYPGSSSSIQATVNPDFAQIEADPTQINLGRYELWYNERRPFFIEGSDLFSSGIQVFYTRRIGRALPDGTRVPILGGLKVASRADWLEIGGLEAVCRETPYADGIEPQSYFSVLRFKITDTSHTSVGLLYAGKDNAVMSNRGVCLDAAWRQGNWDFSGNLAPAWYNAPGSSKSALAGSSHLYWRANNWFVLASYSNIPRDFDVSEIGYVPQHTEDVWLATGPRIHNWGPFRGLTLYAGPTRARDNDDAAHAFYSSSLNAWATGTFTNNWAANVSVAPVWGYEYVSDAPVLDSVFYYPSQNYGMWLQTDASRKLTGFLSAYYCTRSYNYLRHFFAPNGNVSGTVGWRPSPGLKFEANVSNVLELDTLNRIRQVNWIIDPSVNCAITRDLQIRLSGEAVPAARFARANVLLSWNLSPKSWFYVAWNEARSLATGLPLIERIGVVKLRYLFYF